MIQTVARLLTERGISLSAPIALSDCCVTRPYLLERAGIENGTAFVFAVPYYTTKCDDPARNISAYAVSRDYHRFFAALFDEILPLLREAFPGNRFAGFTDHSPIAEAEAAVRAGLGYFGRNHLFLTDDYASFVFLGEIVTDAILETKTHGIRTCAQCGACEAACPVDLTINDCLSALTQKKGALTESEVERIRAHGCAWGCDRCQEACPVTRRAKATGSIYTKIGFFKEKPMARLTADVVNAMSDEDFAERAYSWRGRHTILRNLEILERGEPQ